MKSDAFKSPMSRPDIENRYNGIRAVAPPKEFRHARATQAITVTWNFENGGRKLLWENTEDRKS